MDLFGKLGGLSKSVVSLGLGDNGWIEIVDGTDATTVAAIQDVVDAYTPLDALAETKTAKITEAAAACDAALAPYAARFGVLERLTWETQLKEAEAILPDPEPTAEKYPLIGGIITETGETFGAFAMAVTANNEAWKRISASAIGQRQALVARVKAATIPDNATPAEIAAAVAQVQAIQIKISVS